MISFIELEGFLGVNDRTRIDLAPLTFLFGKNRAGKSSLLLALHYMLDVLRSGYADVRLTGLGDATVDLGGFGRLVHRHDLSRTLAVRVGLGLEHERLSAWIEVRVRQFDTPYGGRPQVSELLVGTPASPAPMVRLSTDRKVWVAQPIRTTLDLAHPALVNQDHATRRLREELGTSKSAGIIEVAVSSGERGTLVPALDRPLQLINIDRRASGQAADEARRLLERLVVGTIRRLVAELGKAIHIGPLRAVPPRDIRLCSRDWVDRWTDGLTAWDTILADRHDLLQRVNAALRRLGAGYTLIEQELCDATEPDEEISETDTEVPTRRLVVDMGASLTVLPSEAGVGVSQLVPIVVAALAGPRRLVLLEQPESLLHPGLQVGLGDLFIEASRDRQLIVETHSEHVLLRVLRRIRETDENELPEGAPAYKAEDLSVLHVAGGMDGMQVHRLRVDAAGEFKDEWPGGFFEERVQELF